MHYNGTKADYERVIHLLREIEFAKSQLAPHDTGHISTAISWMESRVATLTRKLDQSPEPTDRYGRPTGRMPGYRKPTDENGRIIRSEDC